MDASELRVRLEVLDADHNGRGDFDENEWRLLALWALVDIGGTLRKLTGPGTKNPLRPLRRALPQNPSKLNCFGATACFASKLQNTGSKSSSY